MGTISSSNSRSFVCLYMALRLILENAGGGDWNLYGKTGICVMSLYITCDHWKRMPSLAKNPCFSASQLVSSGMRPSGSWWYNNVLKSAIARFTSALAHNIWCDPESKHQSKRNHTGRTPKPLTRSVFICTRLIERIFVLSISRRSGYQVALKEFINLRDNFFRCGSSLSLEWAKDNASYTDKSTKPGMYHPVM